ncbi:MAG: hypothetical protein AAB453_03865 [Patescibacteria group bacterium]
MRKEQSVSSVIHGRRVHAKQRALERYGVRLSNEKSRRLVQLIQNNNSRQDPATVVFVKRYSNTRTQFFVWSKDDREWLRVVYDRERKQIVTVLDKKKSLEPKYIPT